MRFAIDTVGSETASWCQRILAARATTHLESHSSTKFSTGPDQTKTAHLVALTGAPKTPSASVEVHQVPIKLFHAHRKIGGHLSKWLYDLLDRDMLKLPAVEFVDGGLAAVNDALERLRAGSVSGRRLVVKTK